MTIHVLARFHAKPDQADALRRLLVELAPSIRKDRGCQRCNLGTNVADANEFTFIEEWDSQADLDAHLALPYIAAVVAKAEPLQDAPMDFRVHSVTA